MFFDLAQALETSLDSRVDDTKRTKTSTNVHCRERQAAVQVSSLFALFLVQLSRRKSPIRSSSNESAPLPHYIPAMAEAAPAPAAAAPQKTTVRDWSTSKVINVLRFANLCNGILMVIGAVLVFVTGLVSVSFTTVSYNAVACAIRIPH
jgi:hypothetical protein